MAALLLGISAPVAAVTVQVEGRVARPGPRVLADGTRLSDALLAADVAPNAYVTGAVWLREALVPAQRGERAGIVYSLGILEGQARLDGQTALVGVAARLHAAIAAMPASGRERGALLDPRPLELSAANQRLGEGDRLLIPGRPTTVRITGAVAHDCMVVHQPLLDARRYLRSCPRSPAADPDWLYVIQPDGTVQRRGVALWNRDAPQALAPGAVLYVPIRTSALRGAVSHALNDEIAAFLATQPITGSPP